MGKQTWPIGVRVDADGLRILDGVIEQLAAKNPDWQPTRSDAIRYLIASSGSAAVPIASTMPPEKRRSG